MAVNPLLRAMRKTAPKKQEEPEDSLLKKAGNVAVSGLAAMGNLLSIPGDVTRAVLTGENPLTPLAHPFSSEGRVTGRGLLRKAGLVGKRDTWGNFAAGMAVDLLTDPTTYLGVGALAKGAAAGLTGTAKAAQAGQGLMRLGVPLISKGGKEIFTGPTAQRIAGAIGKAAEKVGTTKPMRAARQFLDASVMGRATKEVQRIAKGIYEAQGKGEAAVKQLTTGVARSLESQGKAGAGTLLRREIELPHRGISPESTEIANALGAAARQRVSRGIPGSSFLDDVVPDPALPGRTHKLGYVTRRANEKIVGGTKGNKSPFSGRSPEDVGRSLILKGFGEGTEGVNKLFADPGLKNKVSQWTAQIDAARAAGQNALPLRKQALADIAADIDMRFGRGIGATYQPLKDNGAKLWRVGNKKVWAQVQPANSTPVMRSRYKGLARMALDAPQVLEHPLFPNHPVVDAEQYLLSTADRVAAADGIYDALSSLSKPFAVATKGTTVPVGRVIKELGFNRRMAINNLAQRMGVAASDKLLQLRINKDVADDLMGLWPQYQVPKESGLLLNTIDSFTSLFKAGVLTWPARYVRDVMSGAARNLERGWLDPQSFAQAHNLTRGRAVEGLQDIPAVKQWLAQKGLQATDENASEAVRQLYAARATGHAHVDVATAQGVDPKLESILERVPGRKPVTEFEAARNVLATAAGRTPGMTLNPLHVRGVAGRAASDFGPVAAGDMVGRYTDTINRLSPFVNMLKRGIDPDEAMRLINEAQVDYSLRAFTPHERILKRLFPFYCVPESHEALTSRGWKLWHEIADDDLLLTYKADTGELEWQRPQSINSFDFDGELIEIHRTRKDRRYSFQFTDDHRWPVKRVVRGPATVPPSTRRQIVDDRITIKRGCDLSTGDRLQCVGEFNGKDSILSPRLAAILGWVVTDGYFRWRGNGSRSGATGSVAGLGSCEMIVYQSPHKHLSEIIVLLGNQPRPPHPETGVCAVPVAREDIVELCRVFRCKADLPQIVCGLSRQAAEAMWDAMFKAEGVTTPGTGQRHFAQSTVVNPEVLDAFQILCTLTGRTANISGTGAYIRKRDCYRVDTKRQMQRVPYSGKVWCPTTPNGTWVMRHDGQVVITGNSFTKQQTAYLAKELLSNPGGRLSAAIKASARAHSPDAATPDYIAETMSIPLGETPDGSRRFLTGLGLMHEDPLSFGGGGVRGALLEAASRANPLVKAPLEWMTGQTFFQKGPEGGRPLGDLDPTIGRTISNVLGREKPVRIPAAAEFALSNSPLSRLLTTARQASDPRKGTLTKAANLLTGLRVTDVSPGAQDALRREAVQKLLKAAGGKTFVKSFVPAEDLAEMPPAQREEVQRLQATLNLLNERAKGRKKKAQAK